MTEENERAFHSDKEDYLRLIKGVREFLLEVDGNITPDYFDKQLQAVLAKIQELEYQPGALRTVRVRHGDQEADLVVDRRLHALLGNSFPSGHPFKEACRRYFLWRSAEAAREIRRFRDELMKDQKRGHE